MAQIGHDAEAIAFAKWSVLVENLNLQKHAKNDCTIILEFFWRKKGAK